MLHSMARVLERAAAGGSYVTLQTAIVRALANIMTSLQGGCSLMYPRRGFYSVGNKGNIGQPRQVSHFSFSLSIAEL